jgi:hypothetical protein
MSENGENDREVETSTKDVSCCLNSGKKRGKMTGKVDYRY